MTTATFFIATARSGTQWLADAFRRVYQDVLVTEHEPIRYAYRPKTFLRAHDRLDELRALPEVSEHLQDIHGILESKSYVEVGFPCYAMAPLLVREFGERLRFVHLLRHPVRVAASVVTHGWYQAHRTDTLHADLAPDPMDPGVVQTGYRDRWDDLSAYEKGLFYWTEVHLYGREVHETYPDVPLLTLKFEDIVNPPAALQRLTRFLDLDYRVELADGVGTRVDRYQQTTSVPIEWSEIAGHDVTLELAREFGYDTESVDGRQLTRRYAAKPEPSLFVRGIRKLGRLVRARLSSR